MSARKKTPARRAGPKTDDVQRITIEDPVEISLPDNKTPVYREDQDHQLLIHFANVDAQRIIEEVAKQKGQLRFLLPLNIVIVALLVLQFIRSVQIALQHHL